MKPFLWTARVEGLSFLALMFVAMPLKYGLGLAQGVTHTGRLHGLLVFVFLGTLALAAVKEKWPARKVVWAVVSSMVPFGWVFFEASHRLDADPPRSTP
jgi:integral membrane protein